MLTKIGVLKREQLEINSLSFKPNLVGSVPTKSIYFGIFFSGMTTNWRDTRPDQRTNAPVNEIDEKPESAGK